MAQALAGLKLMTIAKGFDEDFDDLHPKRLRRFHVGPMYSDAFTKQSGPMARFLPQARAPEGEDWALVWTEEELESERVIEERQAGFRLSSAKSLRWILLRDAAPIQARHAWSAASFCRSALSGVGRIGPARICICAQVCGQPTGARLRTDDLQYCEWDRVGFRRICGVHLCHTDGWAPVFASVGRIPVRICVW